MRPFPRNSVVPRMTPQPCPTCYAPMRPGPSGLSCDRHGPVAEGGGAVRTVADVTDDHRGWLITVDEPPPLLRRSFVLGKGFGSGVRRWTHDGVDYVGLTDDVRSPGVVGTERIYRADTPARLERQVKKAHRRSRS